MTTRVHVVNLGPDKIIVQKINPQTSQLIPTPVEIYPGDSVNEYVYDSQSLIVREEPILKRT